MLAKISSFVCANSWFNVTYVARQQINYREEDEIIYKPLSCTELVCNEYQTAKDGEIALE